MFKRIFDIVCSFFGLIVFSPLMITLAVWIKLESAGPVFYRGERTGKYGIPFKMFKFRSMVQNAAQIGGSSTSDDDPRITRSGKFIRKWKLDELAQLISVLKGDMSLVGPRPEVQYYTDMFTEEEQKILTVRPGITDWATLANPDEGAVLAGYDDPDKAYEEIIRPEKLRLQLKYVQEGSFLKDFGIILQTLKAVVAK